jgi:PEP-CTERM motif
MGTRRSVFTGLIVLLALGGTPAFAAGQCQGGPLTMFLQGGFTCTQDNGILTFKSFVYNGPLSSDQIFVSPLDVPSEVGFIFTGNFAVPTGQNATYVLSYFIDPPPIIHGEQLDLDPFGSVMLVEDLCVTAFPCAGGNSLGNLTTTTGNTMASTGLANLNALGIQNTLTLTGGAGGANSQGFDNVTFINPEPSTILLAASGLLGLLAFRSRAKLRRIRF